MFRTNFSRRSLCLSLLTGLAAPAVARAGDFERERKDVQVGAFERVYFQGDSGDRFHPERVIAIAGSEVFAADLPGEALVIDYARVDLSGVPILRNLLGGRPTLSYAEPQYRLGDLLRSGDDLIVAFDRGYEGLAGRLVRRTLALATYTQRGRNKIALQLPRLRPAGGLSTSGGHRVGAVYDAGGALLLAPPMR